MNIKGACVLVISVGLQYSRAQKKESKRPRGSFRSLVQTAEEVRRPATHELDELPDVLPPRRLSAPVLHVGLREHVLDGRKHDPRALDGDDGRGLAHVRVGREARDGRLASGSSSGGRRGSLARLVVRLEKLDALARQPDRARSVERRGHAALERVSERGRTRVEKLATLLLKDVGDELGRVDR